MIVQSPNHPLALEIPDDEAQAETDAQFVKDLADVRNGKPPQATKTYQDAAAARQAAGTTPGTPPAAPAAAQAFVRDQLDRLKRDAALAASMPRFGD